MLAAQKAFQTWSRTSVEEHVAWIKKFQDELMKDMDMLVELDSKEFGKPYQNALNDFYSSYGVIGFYAEEAKWVFGTSVPDKGAAGHAVYHVVEKRPRGVVVGHLAWNYPLANMGLASYLFGHDARAIAKAFETFESGDVFFNGASGNIQTPHVGIKQSGLGCDQSHWALDEYYHLKRISLKP